MLFNLWIESFRIINIQYYPAILSHIPWCSWSQLAAFLILLIISLPFFTIIKYKIIKVAKKAHIFSFVYWESKHPHLHHIPKVGIMLLSPISPSKYPYIREHIIFPPKIAPLEHTKLTKCHFLSQLRFSEMLVSQMIVSLKRWIRNDMFVRSPFLVMLSPYLRLCERVCVGREMYSYVCMYVNLRVWLFGILEACFV